MRHLLFFLLFCLPASALFELWKEHPTPDGMSQAILEDKYSDGLKIELLKWIGRYHAKEPAYQKVLLNALDCPHIKVVDAAIQIIGNKNLGIAQALQHPRARSVALFSHYCRSQLKNGNPEFLEAFLGVVEDGKNGAIERERALSSLREISSLSSETMERVKTLVLSPQAPSEVRSAGLVLIAGNDSSSNTRSITHSFLQSNDRLLQAGAVAALGTFRDLDDATRTDLVSTVTKQKDLLLEVADFKTKYILAKILGPSILENAFSSKGHEGQFRFGLRSYLANPVTPFLHRKFEPPLKLDSTNIGVIHYAVKDDTSAASFKILELIQPAALRQMMANPATKQIAEDLARRVVQTYKSRNSKEPEMVSLRKDFAAPEPPAVKPRTAKPAKIKPEAEPIPQTDPATDLLEALREGDPKKVDSNLSAYLISNTKEPEGAATLAKALAEFVVSHPDQGVMSGFVKAVSRGRVQRIPELEKALEFVLKNSPNSRLDAADLILRFFPISPLSVAATNLLLDSSQNVLASLRRLGDMTKAGVDLREVHWNRIAAALKKNSKKRLSMVNALYAETALRPVLAEYLMPLLPESETDRWNIPELIPKVKWLREGRARSKKSPDSAPSPKTAVEPITENPKVAPLLEALKNSDPVSRAETLAKLSKLKMPQSKRSELNARLWEYAQQEPHPKVKLSAVRVITAGAGTKKTTAEEAAFKALRECISKMKLLESSPDVGP